MQEATLITPVTSRNPVPATAHGWRTVNISPAEQAGRILEVTGAKQTNLSNHLKVLRVAGVVETEPCGRFTYYRHLRAPHHPPRAGPGRLPGAAAAHHRIPQCGPVRRTALRGGRRRELRRAGRRRPHRCVGGETWCTLRPPRFLPDNVDGRALFDPATARRQALGAGLSDTGGVAALGDIVAVPPVRAARVAGLP